MSPERSEAAVDAAVHFEGEIRELIRNREVTWLHRNQARPTGDEHNAQTLIQRVAGASMSEIDLLIAQFQEMRELLQREGERVTGEVAGYVHLNRAALQHVDDTSGRMARWRESFETNRGGNSARGQ